MVPIGPRRLCSNTHRLPDDATFRFGQIEWRVVRHYAACPAPRNPKAALRPARARDATPGPKHFRTGMSHQLRSTLRQLESVVNQKVLGSNPAWGGRICNGRIDLRTPRAEGANEEAHHETYSARGHIAAGSRHMGTIDSRTLGRKAQCPLKGPFRQAECDQ